MQFNKQLIIFNSVRIFFYEMIKILKIALFLVSIAFAFTLGVKFSDSFKGKFNDNEDAEISVEDEMKKTFDENEQKNNAIDVEQQDNNALDTEQNNELNPTGTEEQPVVQDNTGMEVTEPMPMDGVENPPIEMQDNNTGDIDFNTDNTMEQPNSNVVPNSQNNTENTNNTSTNNNINNNL